MASMLVPFKAVYELGGARATMMYAAILKLLHMFHC